MGKIEEEKIERINSAYASEIRMMLKDARDAFAEL